MIKKIFNRYFELFFWIAALIALALADPGAPLHYILCPFRLLGFTWCPGCGLGHAISFLFHGNIKASYHAHWLGIPAVIIIGHRIYTLGRERLRPGPAEATSKSPPAGVTLEKGFLNNKMKSSQPGRI